MIYTVTLNPSIDYIVHVNDLRIGELNRMAKDIKLPGGKGINVSRILKRINSTSIPLGFLGGFTGSFIKDWLSKEQITTKFTSIADDTRINVKLKSTDETEINGLGPVITNEEMQLLKEEISQVTKEDIVIFSGSTPPSVYQGFYQDLIQIVEEKGAQFVIDTTGKDLLMALHHRPLLVKPNNHELAELYQTSFQSVADILPYGKKLIADGAQYAIISMAGDGALLFTPDNIYQSNILHYPVKNSVGAGDSMIAGFVGQYTKAKDPVDAFRWGVACGSATAFSDDLASEEFISALLSEVHITSFKGGD